MTLVSASRYPCKHIASNWEPVWDQLWSQPPKSLSCSHLAKYHSRWCLVPACTAAANMASSHAAAPIISRVLNLPQSLPPFPPASSTFFNHFQHKSCIKHEYFLNWLLNFFCTCHHRHGRMHNKPEYLETFRKPRILQTHSTFCHVHSPGFSLCVH